METIELQVSTDSLKEFLGVAKSKKNSYHLSIFIDDGMIAATDGKRIYAYEHEDLCGIPPTRLVTDAIKAGKHNKIIIKLGDMITATFIDKHGSNAIKFTNASSCALVIRERLVGMKTNSNQGNRVTFSGLDASLMPRAGNYVLKQDHSGMYLTMHEITASTSTVPMKIVLMSLRLRESDKKDAKNMLA